MTPKKTFFYEDELNDDFANNNIETNHIKKGYVYYHKNIFWKIIKFFFYRIIATPVAWFTCYILHGAKIVNKKSLKKIKKSGYFLYGNHTQGAFDAFMPTLISFPKANYIISGPDAFSIKGIATLVKIMGGVPIPETKSQVVDYTKCIKYHIDSKSVVTTYPEGHIWPYFNGVRNFGVGSFNLPIRLKAPVVAFAVTYKERKILKNAPPRIIVYISEPYFLDESLPRPDAIVDLRNKVYSFIKEKTSMEDNVAYYEYIKKQ